MKTLKKYLRLLFKLFKVGLIADLQFRVNFASRVFTDILWYAMQIIAFETLYRHTTTIGSWNLAQTRVFLGVLFVVDGLEMVFINDNLSQISEKIRRGDLDLLLTKPINSQFMISFQRISTSLVTNLLMGLAWLIYALATLPDFNWARVMWLLFLIPCGLATLYGIRFIFSSLAIFFTRADNFQYIWYQLYRLAMRPDSIYVPWVRLVLLSLFPMAVIASVPARALIDPPDYGLFIWVILLSGLIIWSSHRFWRFALRYYTSASS